jgi:hypothetical protein
MHRNVIGLAAFDFILRIILACVMGMSFVIDVLRVNFDDRAVTAAIRELNLPGRRSRNFLYQDRLGSDHVDIDIPGTK